MYNYSLGETINILEGTIYQQIGQVSKKNTEVDHPNSVDLISFPSNELFGKWTREQNFRAFFELHDGYYEQVIEQFYKCMHPI